MLGFAFGCVRISPEFACFAERSRDPLPNLRVDG